VNVFQALADPILRQFPALAAGDLVFAPAPKLDLGDVAMRAFEAARKLGIAPNALAAQICSEVTFGPEVTGTSAAGPYVNFKLDRSHFGRQIAADVLAQGKAFGSNQTGANKRAIIEHTSINPNASPHVGRARNALIGDTLVRVFRFEGFKVEAHYYVNDMGKQIALLVLACDDPAKRSFDEMLDLYVEANRRANEDPEFAATAYALLAKMEEQDEETQKRFHAVTALCLHGQLLVLARTGVRFDVFDRESKFVKDARLDAVLEALRTRDAVFTDEQERLVVDLSKLGHSQEEGRYFVLMRANGSSMYGYRDIAYTLDKMEKNADENIIVLGEDHKLYFEQIGRILNAAGKKTPEPVYYAYILLKDGKMSTREGNVVLLSSFLDEATSRAAQKVDEQCQDLSPQERASIAEKVAVAAVRFAILKVSATKNVIFDWESSLSFMGDTGPYVQYSCARISSILRKYGELPALPERFPVESDSEWALLTKLASFPDTVAGSVRTRSTAMIAQFALETARLFTTFYHDCPVLTAPTEDQRRARVLMCKATLHALSNALNLLGIEVLERM
jgi:arginyl-tRNA synthetase